MSAAAETITATNDQKPVSRDKGPLISPVMDFLLVGGTSLLIFPFTFLTQWRLMAPMATALFTFYASFFVNYPHFMHSYQLLYENFGKKLVEAKGMAKFRLVIAGIVSPVLFALFLFVGAMQDTRDLISYGMTFMYLTVGWHYVKQGYGTLLVLAGRKGFYFKAWEKHLLLFNAYVVGAYAWMGLNLKFSTFQKFSLPVPVIGDYHGPFIVLPEPVIGLTLLLSLLTTICAVAIFLKAGLRQKRFPVNGLVAYASAIYFWWGIVAFNADSSYMAITPLFHSLQYLPFVWKISYEKSRAVNISDEKSKRIALTKTLKFVAIGVVAGLLAFYLVPRFLDIKMGFRPEIFGSFLFSYCFVIFINVHHYFIDYAIWRRDNPEMRYLFV